MEKNTKTEKPAKTTEKSKTTASNPFVAGMQKKIHAASAGARKRPYVLAITLLALVGLAYLISNAVNWFVVARVNGKVINRAEYVAELERASGQQVLEGLVTQELIRQEAEERNIAVTDEEIDAELASLEAQLQQQGQTLDQFLTLQNISREEAREQVRLQKMLEKMVDANQPVATEEVDAFIEQNEQFASEDVDLETLRQQATDQIRQQKVSQQINQLLQQLRQSSDVQLNTREE